MSNVPLVITDDDRTLGRTFLGNKKIVDVLLPLDIEIDAY